MGRRTKIGIAVYLVWARLLIGPVLLSLLIISSVSLGYAQKVVKPLSFEDVEHLLRAGVTANRLARLIDERGIDFELTENVRDKLRMAGASSEVIRAIEVKGGKYTPVPDQYRAVGDIGTISGMVKFRGSPPVPRPLEITRDREICGSTVKTDPSLIVLGGNLVNAVVYIADIGNGRKVAPRNVTLDHKGCEYQPHVLALPAGSTLEILNPDGILHNVHSYSRVNSPFNMAQPKFKKSITVKIDKPEIININCDVHPWMSAWLFVTESPYYSVADSKGFFRIWDVPAGTYKVEVWHETLGKQSQTITVKSREELRAIFEFTSR